MGGKPIFYKNGNRSETMSPISQYLLDPFKFLIESGQFYHERVLTHDAISIGSLQLNLLLAVHVTVPRDG